MIGIPRRWTEAASAKAPDNPVSLAEATRVWVRIGWLSFGGPAGQIALMHRELVEQRRWISDARFLHALSYCMLLPGPEAQQLAIYIGWRSEEHTSELQSQSNLVCRLLLEKKKRPTHNAS